MSGVSQTNLGVQPAGQTGVNISGSITPALPTPGAAQTLKTIAVQVTSTAQPQDLTLYTVTAGKTFYCLGMQVNHTGGTAGSQNATITDGAGGTVLMYLTITQGTGQYSPVNLAAAAPIFSVAATHVIYWHVVNYSGSGAVINVLLWGYEA